MSISSTFQISDKKLSVIRKVRIEFLGKGVEVFD